MARDPLDVLRSPVVPLAADAGFAARLRSRIEHELDRTTKEPPMTTTDTTATTRQPAARSHVPVGMQAVAPYLAVHDARAALDFYREIFAAEVGEPIVMPDGRIGHVDLAIGGAAMMLADEFPEIGVVSPRTQEGSSVSLVVYVPDVDATFAAAIDAGATEERPVADQFHGARAGWLVDPFGHRWMVATQLPSGEATADDEPAPEAGAGAGDQGSIFYFAYGSPDPDRSRRFFAEVLGWRLEEAPNGFHIANTSPPGGVHRADASDLTVWFRVDDIQAAVARVRAMGGQADEPELYASGWSATCRDDQGAEFSISQPAPGYA